MDGTTRLTARASRSERAGGAERGERGPASDAARVLVGAKPLEGESDAGAAVSAVARAIGEPARARMLFSLMDGHARTGTELAMVGEVTPSTASLHVKRLVETRLVTVFVQGKHRYYSLAGPDVASALEHLSVVAIGARDRFVPRTPDRLRAARTCYDHLAGALGVALHDRLTALRWIAKDDARERDYEVTPAGERGLAAIDIDVERARALRRRLACVCLDWSERRPHLGGAIGAALLAQAVKRRWVAANRHDRALEVTNAGRREFRSRFGLVVP